MHVVLDVAHPRPNRPPVVVALEHDRRVMLIPAIVYVAPIDEVLLTARWDYYWQDDRYRISRTATRGISKPRSGIVRLVAPPLNALRRGVA